MMTDLNRILMSFLLCAMFAGCQTTRHEYLFIPEHGHVVAAEESSGPWYTASLKHDEGSLAFRLRVVSGHRFSFEQGTEEILVFVIPNERVKAGERLSLGELDCWEMEAPRTVGAGRITAGEVYIVGVSDDQIRLSVTSSAISPKLQGMFQFILAEEPWKPITGCCKTGKNLTK